MKIFGFFLIICSFVLGVYSYNMDTTVEVNNTWSDDTENYQLPERVHNIGLLQERQNLFILSGVLFIAGIILVSISKEDKTTKYNLRYKSTWESAKMAEFRGNTEEAIKLYYDTLYYLENDFSEESLDRYDNDKRIFNIREIRTKIDSIENPNQESIG